MTGEEENITNRVQIKFMLLNSALSDTREIRARHKHTVLKAKGIKRQRKKLINQIYLSSTLDELEERERSCSL